MNLLHHPTRHPQQPDAVASVLSFLPTPNSKEAVNAYRSSGVKEVWVVLPHNAEVLIFAPTGITELRRKDTQASPLLPAFSLPLEELSF